MLTAWLSIFVILIGFITAYILSLYALAVYIDPEEVESLFAGVSRRRRSFLKRLAADPRAFVQVAAVYRSLVLIIMTVLLIPLLQNLADVVGLSRWFLVPVGLLGLWLLTVFIIDFLPRRASRRALGRRMPQYLWLTLVLYWILYPIVLVYRRVTAVVGDDDQVTEEEKEEIVERAIETLAEQAGIGETIVEEDEKEMIGHIFLLDQTIVREIMSPRQDITGINKNASFAEIQEIVKRDGHSRFPVYEDTIDKIIGVLYVKDLFNAMPKAGEEFVISKYLRTPYFIPESKVIGDLLREFRARQLHIAVVADEYGGVAGLVTLEDILEEIVGEIQDEHDSEQEPIVRLSENTVEVDASLLVEDLQDYLDTDFDQGEYDTVGGMIYDLVGSVPQEGEKIRWNSLELEVVKCDGQRIVVVRVRQLQRPSA